MTNFDLRSDTVTRPCPAMREAMLSAEVGDDVYREDPSMAKLEARVAEVIGKEAALFVPSGTMANQIAILCHTQPADELITGVGSHCGYYESGATSALAGVQIVEVGSRGLFTGADVQAALKPKAYYCPNPSLVVVENTHNRGGGTIFPQADIAGIEAVARTRDMRLHLDGARLWNAAIASNAPPATLAEPFDTVAVCFSKGLGAPVGSALCGSRSTIDKALRLRKMLGGGMRQAGLLAAGALFALENNRERIALDHEAASALGARLAEIPGVTVSPVATNIVNVDVPCDASHVVEQARAAGVLFAATDPKRVRIVTHKDVVSADFEQCISDTTEAFRAAILGNA